jgi:CO/xanthine dehydrogenase Mo-binding subunit
MLIGGSRKAIRDCPEYGWTAQIRGFAGIAASGPALTPDTFRSSDSCHVCGLEVDPDTGTVTIDRFTTVDDLVASRDVV